MSLPDAAIIGGLQGARMTVGMRQISGMQSTSVRLSQVRRSRIMCRAYVGSDPDRLRVCCAAEG
jgi:hypothetical protein